jgi:hypothetical protein
MPPTGNPPTDSEPPSGSVTPDPPLPADHRAATGPTAPLAPPDESPRPGDRPTPTAGRSTPAGRPGAEPAGDAAPLVPPDEPPRAADWAAGDRATPAVSGPAAGERGPDPTEPLAPLADRGAGHAEPAPPDRPRPTADRTAVPAGARTAADPADHTVPLAATPAATPAATAAAAEPPPVGPPDGPPPGGAGPAGPAGPRGRSPLARFWRSPVGVAVVVLLALVVVLTIVELSGGDDRADQPAAVAQHVVSEPLAGRRAADFALVSGATSITLRTVGLGDRLLVASTPSDASQVPKLVVNADRLELQLVATGHSGPSSVDIELNSSVRWAIRVAGGATQQTLDLAGGQVTGVDLVAGASRIDLELPHPSGTVSVQLTTGASEFSVHTPAGVLARARIGSGAGSVRVNGAEHTGVAPGAVFSPTGWDTATDRYDINVSAGVSVLTVDRR